MALRLLHVTLVVPDYEVGLAFYRDVLGFRVLEDRPVPEQGKRFVVLQPDGGGASFVLGRAGDAAQQAAIGRQTGGRVAFFLATDDFAREYARLRDRGVEFVRPPQCADYGTVAVFRDPFGNLWDLLEPSAAARLRYGA